jgi:hypothetical protein
VTDKLFVEGKRNWNVSGNDAKQDKSAPAETGKLPGTDGKAGSVNIS